MVYLLINYVQVDTLLVYFITGQVSLGFCAVVIILAEPRNCSTGWIFVLFGWHCGAVNDFRNVVLSVWRSDVIRHTQQLVWGYSADLLICNLHSCILRAWGKNLCCNFSSFWWFIVEWIDMALARFLSLSNWRPLRVFNVVGLLIFLVIRFAEYFLLLIISAILVSLLV